MNNVLVPYWETIMHWREHGSLLNRNLIDHNSAYAYWWHFTHQYVESTLVLTRSDIPRYCIQHDNDIDNNDDNNDDDNNDDNNDYDDNNDDNDNIIMILTTTTMGEHKLWSFKRQPERCPTTSYEVSVWSIIGREVTVL